MGITFPGLIFLVLMTLKLAEIGPVAHWSWWLVTSPLWFGLVLGVLLITAAVLIKALRE